MLATAAGSQQAGPRRKDNSIFICSRVSCYLCSSLTPTRLCLSSWPGAWRTLAWFAPWQKTSWATPKKEKKEEKKKNKDRSLSLPADATLESTNYVVVFSAGLSFAHCSPRIKIPKSPSYSSPWRRSIFDSFLKTLITMENIDTRQHFLQHCN